VRIVRVAVCLLGAAASSFASGLVDHPRLGSHQALAATREYLMGTVAEIRVLDAPGRTEAERAVAAAFDELRTIDRLMAVQRPDSDVSRLNRDGARGPVVVDVRVIEVLQKSLEVSRLSDGAFDVTVEPVIRAWGFLDGRPHQPAGPPPAIAGSAVIRIDREGRTVGFDDPRAAVDLGGIAKGYALDRARDVLRAHGVTSAFLDLGGNVAMIGRPGAGELWRIGVRHPRREGAILGVLEVDETAISTSGDAEQYVEVDSQRLGHIFDPRTGAPARGPVSVTVVLGDAALGDGLSTAAVVLGEERSLPMLRRSGAGAVFARLGAGGSLEITTTPGMRFARAEGQGVPAPRKGEAEE
jgi:thiamine biosynthesis lipoprotein